MGSKEIDEKELEQFIKDCAARGEVVTAEEARKILTVSDNDPAAQGVELRVYYRDKDGRLKDRIERGEPLVQ